MQKIKMIVDSASDIPDEELQRLDIEMTNIPITVDGQGYYERESFSIREFYGVLEASKEIPLTSRVPAAEYAELYKKAWEQGYTDVINITINSTGSGTYDAALMAIDQFLADCPEAGGKMAVHVVDSKSYCLAYGYPTMEAAKMVQQGKTAQEILEYLHDFFDRVEVYLACYTLDYAKKSGRITAAAAFVGDVLGLRPIISLIDGQTKTVEKVRGDKQVVGKLVELYKKRRDTADSVVIAVSGSVDEYGEELRALLEQETGREIPHYKAGASIVINAGPKIAAFVVLGKKRGSK